MNEELHSLYVQDQADRKEAMTFNREQMQELGRRDSVRRQRVEELLASGALQTPEDYFHAAMIFQHGGALEYYWQAYELAKKGAELGHTTCRWLTAAAYDRWLLHQGKPQKYGTQYVNREGRWILYDVDPETTDAQRAELNVPSLAQALQKADRMNQTNPPIPHPD